MIVSSCVNGFNANSLVHIGYFMMFICVYNLTQEQIKMFVKTILFVVGYSCMLGFVDPAGGIVPGFSIESISTSLHFWNPNYAGYIIAVCIILTVMQLKNTNKLIEELDKAIEFAEQELNQKEVYKGQHELLKIQIANYKKMKSFFI
jgi:hypothetical protein